MSTPASHAPSSTITPAPPSDRPRLAEALLTACLAATTLMVSGAAGIPDAGVIAAAGLGVLAVATLPRRLGDATRVPRALLVVATGAALATLAPELAWLALVCSVVAATAFPLRLQRSGGIVVTVCAAAALAVPPALAPSADPQAVTQALVGIAVVLAAGLLAAATARSVETAYRRARASADRAHKADERLSHAERHDRRTGLPNRDQLLQRAGGALAHQQEIGEAVGLLVVDIDRVAALRDAVGPQGADDVLAHVATRLRAARPVQDLVARTGDTQFAVLVPEVGLEGCGGIARRLAALVAEPVVVGGQEVSVSCSVGAVVSSPAIPDAGELLLAAEEASRAARRSGRTGWAEFDQAMRAHSLSQSALELALRKALRAGTIGLTFAPLVRLAGPAGTEQVVAVSAVPRWLRADGTAVPPSRFGALAEDLGLGPALGFQLLDRALDAMAHWDASARPVPQVSIGLGRGLAREPDLAQTVAVRLAARGLAPARLAVSVDGALLEDDDVVTTLSRLRSLGVTVALDGLGRAGVSLATFATAPADRAVVDRTLLAGPTPARTAARHLVALCHDLGLVTVADGIETVDELTGARMLGMTHAQGHLMGRPVGAEDVVPSLAGWSGARPATAAHVTLR